MLTFLTMCVNHVQVIVINVIIIKFVLTVALMILTDSKDNLVHVDKSFIFIKISVNNVVPSALHVNIPQLIAFYVT